MICTIRADHLLSAYANNKGVTSSTKEQHTKCTTHHQASRQNPSIPNKIHGWTTRPENTLDDSYGSHDSWIFHTIPRDRTKLQNPPWPERLSSGEKSLFNNIYGSAPRSYDSWIQQTTREYNRRLVNTTDDSRVRSVRLVNTFQIITRLVTIRGIEQSSPNLRVKAKKEKAEMMSVY